MDGEGCYTVNIAKHHKSALRISPLISISMKTGSWVNRVSKILEEYNITYRTTQRNYNQTEFSIKYSHANDFIKLLLPYTEVKKPVMEKLLELPSRTHRNRFVPMQQEYIDKIVEF